MQKCSYLVFRELLQGVEHRELFIPYSLWHHKHMHYILMKRTEMRWNYRKTGIKNQHTHFYFWWNENLVLGDSTRNSKKYIFFSEILERISAKRQIQKGVLDNGEVFQFTVWRFFSTWRQRPHEYYGEQLHGMIGNWDLNNS